MLPRGAKPKLPQIRVLEGNRSKRPIAEMPKLPRTPTAPPAEMVRAADPVALQFWEEHWAILLEAKLVTIVDRRMFQRCCEQWSISCDPEVSWGKRHTAHREWVRLAGMFGLSPVDRVRLAKVPLKDSPGTKWSSAL